MSIRIGKYRGGGWEVDIRVRLPDGTRYRERVRSPVPSKTGTLRWAEARALEMATHGRLQKRDVPTLSEFAVRYIEEYAKAEQLKPRTIKERERIIEHDLKPRFGSMKLDAISAADVQKLKAALASKKPSTVNNVLNALSTMLKCAVNWGVVSQAPAVKLVKADKLGDPQFYEPVDFERLVEAAAAIDPRIHLFVLLGGDAGLRCGEIIALEQSDIDLKRGVLTVNRSESEGFITSPKGRRGRKVELTVRLREALTANRHLRGDRVLWRDDGFLKVSQVLLAKWMIRAQRRAVLRATGGIHILRHTFCSRLAMAGASTRAIQELAGHASIGTTQRYMHLSPAAKSVAIGLLDKGADLAASGSTEDDQKAPADGEVRGDGGETKRAK